MAITVGNETEFFTYKGKKYQKVAMDEPLCVGCSLHKTDLCDPINDYLQDTGIATPCWSSFRGCQFSQIRLVSEG